MEPLSTSQPITRDIPRLVSNRTIELAKLAGRASHEIRQADYNRAKREISGVKAVGSL